MPLGDLKRLALLHAGNTGSRHAPHGQLTFSCLTPIEMVRGRAVNFPGLRCRHRRMSLSHQQWLTSSFNDAKRRAEETDSPRAPRATCVAAGVRRLNDSDMGK